MIADALSNLLNKVVNEGKIHGVRASSRGPKISHLFFEDDSLLFSRANRNECSKIVDILHLYEVTSGQKINNIKSEVSLAKACFCQDRKS